MVINSTQKEGTTEYDLTKYLSDYESLDKEINKLTEENKKLEISGNTFEDILKNPTGNTNTNINKTISDLNKNKKTIEKNNKKIDELKAESKKVKVEAVKQSDGGTNKQVEFTFSNGELI